ncbi:MAG: SDR family NAD(P)-dependent oxidoreductase [Planctomycetia bacterium]
MSRHFVIVGGSRGLGRAFSVAMVAEGHAVSVLARSRGDVAGVMYHECDLDTIDAPTVLDAVSCAGGEIDALACFQRYRGTSDEWAGEFQTTLTATKSLIENSPRTFASHGLRSIVLVSSVNALFISPALPPGYHVAKAALCQMARYYACTLGPLGIRVNAVCPSTFVKPETERHYAARPDVVARLAAASPLGRMASYRDVNEAVGFLLGERASFITGQTLVVDGGISLRWPEHL